MARSRCSDSLPAGPSGDGIPVGTSFQYPSRPAPRSTQPPVRWVPYLSRELSGGGVALVIHPLTVLRLRMVRTICLSSLCAFVACYGVTLTFFSPPPPLFHQDQYMIRNFAKTLTDVAGTRPLICLPVCSSWNFNFSDMFDVILLRIWD